MSMLLTTPDDQRWQDVACVIETFTGQAQALSNMGSRESQRVTRFGQATCQIEEAVASLAQR